MYHCGQFADHWMGDSAKAVGISASSGHDPIWFHVDDLYSTKIYENRKLNLVQIPEFCRYFWIWPEILGEILVLRRNSAGAVQHHGGYKC